MRRQVLLYALFALIVRKGSLSVEHGFSPLPIPISNWHHESRNGRVGTLQKTLITEEPSFAVVVPKHYWEDALRHSVYLTLVRDKIDQLIAKGDTLTSNWKLDSHDSKETNDNDDLWDKIKSAPFDRIEAQETPNTGEVTIIANGRLLEENTGYRFTEDETSTKKCSNDTCMEGVKAFWSVKRVRHRDIETSPGKYHYELTFSVITQSPKKQKTMLENPARTFTIQETVPEKITKKPYEYLKFDKSANTNWPRDEKDIWLHRNIMPTTARYNRRQQTFGMDRIFSSLFDDYDYEDEPPPPPRYKPNTYIQTNQYSKLGFSGISNEQHQPNKYVPYAYKPAIKYFTPPTPQIVHHFLDYDQSAIPIINRQYIPQSKEYRYYTPINGKKSSKPIFLPTLPPPNPIPPPANYSVNYFHNSDIAFTTNVPEIITVYNNMAQSNNRHKATTMKISYSSEQIRTPLYNTPSGIFVTLDKKPFKPMPPLKAMHVNKYKTTKPTDFKPSPQVYDVQFSEPDPLFDTVFRPITMNYESTAEAIETAETGRPNDKNYNRNNNEKKTQKKYQNMTRAQSTTNLPEIITVQSNSAEDIEITQWADVIGAFSKSTPITSQNEVTIKKNKETESTTPLSTSTTVSMTKAEKKTTTDSETPTTPSKPTTLFSEPSTTTTTSKPKKRTRPPLKFSKFEKFRKHKRVTTTTNAPENFEVKYQSMNSAPLDSPVSMTDESNNTTKMTSFSTTSISTQKPNITSKQTTSTMRTPTKKSTTETLHITSSRSKSKNRFRQSTLMLKGTSIKHDRWNMNRNSAENEKTNTPPTENFPQQTESSSLQTTLDTLASMIKPNDDESGSSDVTHLEFSITTERVPAISEPTSMNDTLLLPSYENNEEHNIDSEYSYIDNEQLTTAQEENNIKVDHNKSELTFQTSTGLSIHRNETTHKEDDVTENTTGIPITTKKNKTKCKKKNTTTSTTTSTEATTMSDSNDEIYTESTTKTGTDSTTPDFLDEILTNFSFQEEDVNDSVKSELDKQDSEKDKRYIKAENDFEDFLYSLEENKHHEDDQSSEQYEDYQITDNDDKSLIQNDSYNNEKEIKRAGNSHKEYYEQPYSLLELLVMD